jgi:4-oxalocrotonate tautomerase
MPFIQVHLVAGRDPAAVRQCLKEVARTVHRTLGAPLDSIRVAAIEVPPGQWLVGDRTREELQAGSAESARP